MKIILQYKKITPNKLYVMRVIAYSSLGKYSNCTKDYEDNYYSNGNPVCKPFGQNFFEQKIDCQFAAQCPENNFGYIWRYEIQNFHNALFFCWFIFVIFIILLCNVEHTSLFKEVFPLIDWIYHIYIYSKVKRFFIKIICY